MQHLREINWNHLYYFYEVAKAKSLKEGAETVGGASSTLSEQIKKLENNFQQKLFIRSSKGLQLTEVGKTVFERAKVIFEEGSKLLEQFSEDIIGGYPANVGIEESILFDLADEFVSQYWDLYTPFGTVNTYRQSEHAGLIQNILNDNLDWGITHQFATRKSVLCEKIGTFEIVFCCSSELFDKFKTPSDLLNNIPLAEINADSAINKIIYSYLADHEVYPKEKICSDHISYLKKLCQRGRCVLMLPYNPLENYEGLKTFTLNDKAIDVSLYAVWKKENSSLVSIKKLKELIKFKISQTPPRYQDIDFQIEISDVAKEALKDN